MLKTTAPLMNTYPRFDVTFVRGEGSFLFDSDGKPYLDCLSGIAVVPAGHANKAVVDAISNQARKLSHASNLYYSEPMQELAVKLNAISGNFGRVFFGNSGAEANECAIKLVRKYFSNIGKSNRYEIICAYGGFHGRTLATLAATGQPEKWPGFEPLPTGFLHAEFNNLESFKSKITNSTAAILIEPIQGESGVIPASKEFIRGLRELCDETGIVLVFDEIQTGMGRTGSWWAWQTYGVKPDIFTSAKGLANGLPIGACLAAEPFASAFVPGDHGSTFGGNPIVCSAALATLDFLESSGSLSSVRDKGALFAEFLGAVSGVKEVRGSGLMLGVGLNAPHSKAVTKRALELGLVVNAPRPDTVRLLPPLTISDAEIRVACDLLSKAIIEACVSSEK